MLRKNLQIIILVLFMVGSSIAGDKIRLKLHQPPPNKMPVSSLWAMDIENTTKEDVTIYLFGTVNGDRQGEIVGGTSKPFKVKPGKSTYGYDDFKSGEVKWVNKTIQEIIFRTGEVPEDNYTICVTAYYEDGNVAEQQQCIMQLIVRGPEGIITLISPSDNEELKSENPINFMWTGTGLKGPYTLQIKELKNGQTNEQAMKENRIFFEKKDIKTSTYQYGLNDPKLEAGKKYVWVISTGDITSDVWAFSLDNVWVEPIELKVLCLKDTIGGLIYELTFKIQNPVGWKVSVTSILKDPVLNPTGYTYYVNPPDISTSVPIDILNGATSNDIIIHIVDLAPADNPFRLRISYSYTDGGGNTASDTKFFDVKLPSCCVIPPPNMVDWWTFDETSGTNSTDRVSFDNSGTHMNSPVFTTGMVGGALNFSGSQYVEVANHPEVNFGPCESFTIDAWIKTNGKGQDGVFTILDKREKGSCASLGYSLYIYQGRIGIQIGVGPTYKNYNAPSTAPLLNTQSWHLVAVTYDGAASLLTFYEDGAAVGTVTSLLMTNLNNFATLVIGGRHPNFGFDSFEGSIDELEIFKRALSQTEIQSIFDAKNSGKCKD